MTVEEARDRGVCRICGKPVYVGYTGAPKDAHLMFGEEVYPRRITFNFGAEFSYTECLAREDQGVVEGE